MNSLPKTVTRQRRDCDLNPAPSAPESSTLTTRLPSHPANDYVGQIVVCSLPAGEPKTAVRGGISWRQLRSRSGHALDDELSHRNA